MKAMTVLFLFMVVFGVSVSAQSIAEKQDLVRMLVSDHMSSNRDSLWIETYAAQLNSLLKDRKITPAAYLATAALFEKETLPENPLVAAFMVYNMVTESDALLRSGCSMAELRVRMKRAWKLQAEENRTLLGAKAGKRKMKKNRPNPGDAHRAIPIKKDKEKGKK